MLDEAISQLRDSLDLWSEGEKKKGGGANPALLDVQDGAQMICETPLPLNAAVYVSGKGREMPEDVGRGVFLLVNILPD